ncbi:MAG: hypothetical protein KAR31_00640 [Candidatus Omnitrophica bacterium]|nr:hypothetical protein [Candidatus Omnitrophota bacterium]MCK5081387.1 hypothetical protein [Candidatus Omnitrophota bacterium]
MTIDQELFKKLIEICGVKQSVLEILGVYHGLKKARRQGPEGVPVCQ